MSSDTDLQQRCLRCRKTKPLSMFPADPVYADKQKPCCSACKEIIDVPGRTIGMSLAIIRYEAKKERQAERQTLANINAQAKAESQIEKPLLNKGMIKARDRAEAKAQRKAQSLARAETEELRKAEQQEAERLARLAHAEEELRKAEQREAKRLARLVRAEEELRKAEQREAKRLARLAHAEEEELRKAKREEMRHEKAARLELKTAKKLMSEKLQQTNAIEPKGVAKAKARAAAKALAKAVRAENDRLYFLNRLGTEPCAKRELDDLLISQEFLCAYCNRFTDLTVDHIFPTSRGGGDELPNLCWACQKCNSSKGDKTPDEWTDRWYLRKQ